MAKGDVTAPHHHTTIKLELIHCIVMYTHEYFTLYFLILIALTFIGYPFLMNFIK